MRYDDDYRFAIANADINNNTITIYKNKYNNDIQFIQSLATCRLIKTQQVGEYYEGRIRVATFVEISSVDMQFIVIV